ncbi:hypothetical protein Tco_0975690 [Tanacetum coccineum]|uniref:Uncharacterized protein n=1 Tax=Tanacetum coccineum TaxID=301880 RepID=A0ABQ5EF42_9ASTR
MRDDHQSLPPNTSRKSHATLRGMILKGSDLPSGATEPLIVASLAPTSDVGPVDSVSGLNLRTRTPHMRYVVSSDGSHHSDSYSEATSFVRSLVADVPVVTVAVTTTADANVAAGLKIRDESKDFENIRDSASAGVQLVTKLTADLSGFQFSHDELNSKVSSLESERDCLAAQKSSLESAFELFKEPIEALQDEQAKALGDRSPEYLQALGQAIGCAVNKGIQDGLKAGIDHGKAKRDLSVKDASIIDLMDSLCLEGVLAEIPRAEDLQPSPAQLMLPIHRQEDNVEAIEKRLSLTDVMTLFVEPLSSKSLTGETSTSAAPITTFSTTFASSVIIPRSSVVINQVLDAEPHSEDPPPITFEKEELSTSSE